MAEIDTAEALLGLMVACDTVNARYAGRASGESRLAGELETLALGWGLKVTRFPVPGGGENLLVAYEPNPGGEWLLGESHLDTVGVAGMTVPPFAATLKEGRIYGRGTCDTKGSGAALLWSLKTVAQQGSRVRNLGVLFTIDEEAGMTGAAALAAGALRQWPGKLRGIIVGEPTGLQPVVAHNGVVRWTSVTRGVAAHSADPARGRSAISAMLKVVEALEAHYVPTALRTHPLTGAAAASVNVIRGGTQVNIIPERCEIEVDRRLVPGETAAGALADRDRILATVTSADLSLQLEHLEPYIVPPLAPENNLGLHRWMAPVLERLNLDATARGARYVTNGSHYSSAGAPVIVLGPGHLSQAHTRDEWLSVEQLHLAVRLYSALMTEP